MSKALEAFEYIKNDPHYCLPTCKKDHDKMKEVNDIVEKELKQHDKLKTFIYKEKELIKKRIKELDPDYNEPVADCEECQMWTILFTEQKVWDKIIKEVLENE